MNDEEYGTNNIGEASYLYQGGVQLLTAINPQGFEYFVFGNKDNVARRLVEEYYEDAAAPARSLFTAMGRLRREVTLARRAR